MGTGYLYKADRIRFCFGHSNLYYLETRESRQKMVIAECKGGTYGTG